MTLPVALAVLAGTVACLLFAGAVAGWLAAEVLDERDRRRDSRPGHGRIGGREHGAPATARVFVLPDAGPPPEGGGARLPDVRPRGHSVDTPTPRH